MDEANGLIDTVISRFFAKIEGEGKVPAPMISRLRQLAKDGQLADSQEIEEAMKDGDLQNGQPKEH